ncbi:hypothetical protein DDB_G0275353 [Dictyostelium discoideum AX4]|uniref:VTT domain-containing protein n=1 Tax=Dictyostelium discoideum TaxID=44689 RepID=Q553S3_DICDI|nr:hypothetical protein DDB_G0275353 [Dictyostelium discoideum AX4]EAL69742.2 hypothetical protein DDB_G0275353 [Dictyostelium discoideum AX4]|eukprot:XP_643674.2 hypothetical protein DDB_G0275353 [Dictyostelium discoideum AX4]
MTNLSTSSNDNIYQEEHQIINTSTDELSSSPSKETNNNLISPPFNSKFFKSINENTNQTPKFTHLENKSDTTPNNNNNSASKNKNKRNSYNSYKSFEDEDLFREGGQSINGASDGSSSPPIKIKLQDTHYELIQNGNQSINENNNGGGNGNGNSVPKFLNFEEIVNNENNNIIKNSLKGSGGGGIGRMGLLSTSSSSFVEKVTAKERFRYFINFVIHQIKTSTWLTWVKLFVLVCIITLFMLAIFKFKIQSHLSALQEFVGKFGIVLGGLLYVGIFMLLIIFLIPVTIPTIIGGMTFGIGFGILFVWTASILGGVVAFFLGRYVLRKRISKRIEKNRKLVAVDQAIGQEGWKIVLLLRLTPIVPESILNYTLSVTKVNFWHYLICSGIGMIPGCSFFVYVGSSLRTLSDVGNGESPMEKGKIIMYVISGVLMVVSITFITIIVKRAVNKKLEADDQKGLLDEEERLMNEQDDLISGNDYL